MEIKPEAENQRLQTEINSLLAPMSPEARRLALDNSQIVTDAQGRITTPIQEAVYEVNYRCTPVDFSRFVNDPYFPGGVLRGNIFPRILEDVKELFEGDYIEVLLAGAIGWGKTLMASVGMTFDMYRISCLKNPADAYGLVPGANVVFINVSINKKQATRVLFRGIRHLVLNCPYFKNEFPYDEHVQTELRFPLGVSAYPVAATEQSMLGEGVFSAAFDELNFYPIISNSKRLSEGGTYDEATVLYNRLSRRIRSRMNQRGRLPGHLWMISSARYPTDFTERKKTEALTNKGIFVRDYAAWETRPASSYMPGRFQVEVGDTTKRSRVLTGEETDVNPETVLEVPMDFKDAFDKDPEGAVRDYGGISTLAVIPYIVRRDLVAAMFEAGKQAGLKHPFTRETVTLQDSNGDLVVENLPWMDYPTRDAAGRPAVDERGKPVMKRKLFDTKYFAHIDLAKSHDACGIAICYVSRSVKVLRGIAKDQHYEVCPEIRTALLLRVVAPPNGEILVSTVRGVLYKLHELGMEFGKISYDSWGSLESIQILQSQGYEAEHLSVVTTPQPYATLKEAIYDGRLYYVRKLEEELLGLQYDAKKNKIDHRPNGSKDLADALAGAVYHCSQADIPGTAEVMMPSRGIVDTKEEIWEKLARGVPITEQEFEKL